MSLRVLVVDDSALYRQLVKNVLRDIPGVEVVGTATSGADALEKIPQLRPHLLTLDVQMPEMNGLELLREIKRRRWEVKSVMLSSLTAEGAQTTTDALLAGAFDFIQKPGGSDATINRAELLARLSEKILALEQSLTSVVPIRIAGKECESRSPSPSGHQAPSEQGEKGAKQPLQAVLIGTSTGGPIALREVIPRLPAGFPVPILIVQHMPPKYTASLAARIHEASAVPVCEAAHGMLVESGNVYIAPGGLHMGIETLRDRKRITTSEDPPEHNCRPAVDFLFRSASEAYQGNVLAVILTGMGRDGTEGCRRVKSMGGMVLAQHPEGCTVFGMPKAIVEEQLADRVVPLERMASWIVRMVEENR